MHTRHVPVPSAVCGPSAPRRPGFITPHRFTGHPSASHAAGFLLAVGLSYEPDCGGMWVHLFVFSSESRAPQPARQAGAGAMASQIRPLSEPTAEPIMSKARWHRIRPAGPPKASFSAKLCLRLPLASFSQPVEPRWPAIQALLSTGHPTASAGDHDDRRHRQGSWPRALRTLARPADGASRRTAQ